MLAAGHPPWPVSRWEQPKPLLLKYQDASEKKKRSGLESWLSLWSGFAVAAA